jgi:hypothetical protein
MNAVVVYESVYGNTRAVAEAIAEGLGGAKVVPVRNGASEVEEAALLVVGGPTHVHGLATASSRRAAVEAVWEDGQTHVEPGVTDEPGLRAWLRDLPQQEKAQTAAFDTRLDRSPWFTGVASRGIAKRLRRRGYEVIGTESFLVEDSEGPLAEGELERARAWGAELIQSLPSAPGGS